MTDTAGAADDHSQSAFGAHLDAMRGLAALAVVVYHIRYKFFLDYTDIPSPGLVTQAFYVLTSFGHDAVMVFFVLSGYLITGTVVKDLRTGRWSWSRYLVNRLTRLYIVIVPGLVLTMLWDRVGLQMFGNHVAYTGIAQAWKHDFFDVGMTSGLRVFVANLGFLEAIHGTPPLGSNVPLWSLTYEFAYYLLFPVVALTFWPGQRVATRALYALAIVLLAYHFGSRILLYFPLWLFGLGALLAPLPVDRTAEGQWTVLRNLTIVAVVVGAAAFRHSGSFNAAAGSVTLELGDFVLGAVCAAALWALQFDTRRTVSPLYARLSRQLAAISFSLYVFHMPFLIFVRAFVNSGPSWRVTPLSMGAAIGLTVATVAYATGAWFLFERHTPRVRGAVAKLLALGVKRPLRQAVGS